VKNAAIPSVHSDEVETEMRRTLTVLIKGAGDVATGVAHTLAKDGFKVVMTEIPQPITERRAVAFSEAVYEREWTVEGLSAKLTEPADVETTIESGKIPVVVDPKAEILRQLKPDVLIDAIMAKRNTGTKIDDAPMTIGLGPGFQVGKDVHAAIETSEGPELGKPYYQGSPKPFHGTPCSISGKTHERVILAPHDGVLEVLVPIGAHIEAGQTVARVDKSDVRAGVSGVLRGIMRDGLRVSKDCKLGDIDPRDQRERCFMIAERSAIIGEGVLEAIRVLTQKTERRT